MTQSLLQRTAAVVTLVGLLGSSLVPNAGASNPRHKGLPNAGASNPGHKGLPGRQGLPAPAHARPAPDRGLLPGAAGALPRCTLVSAPAQRIEAVLTLDATAPNLSAQEWVV